MDINFHYYAVKAISSYVGFSEEDANTIASYSQFVDDYDLKAPFFVSNVPDEAKPLTAKGLELSNIYLFKPVTTGFNSWFDMVELASVENQKKIVVPFHFITQKPLKELEAQERSELRVKEARCGDDSLIQSIMAMVKNEYLEATEEEKPNLLYKIGVVLHIFADTYAHQCFSGFRGWENHSKLTSSTKMLSETREADSFSFYWSEFYHMLPSIGHTNVSHEPDDSNHKFKMKLKKHKDDNAYSWEVEKNNVSNFILCAMEITKYLKGFVNGTTGGETNVNLDKSDFFQLLADGLRVDKESKKPIDKQWEKIFKGYDYKFNYSKLNMFKSLMKDGRELSDEEYTMFMDNIANEELASDISECDDLQYTIYSNVTPEFYDYNIFADEIRWIVDGKYKIINGKLVKQTR